ncbi:MAG: hypothetical protein ABIZ09_01715 [Rhodoferax sp.]
MSISSVQNTNTANNTASTSTRTGASAAGSSTASFASTLSNVSNGTPYSDAEVKNFFASKPNAKQIADKASSLGLTEDQIAKAMTVGGYEASKDSPLKTQIENFVANAANGYAWDASGELTAGKSTAQATTADSVMPAAQDIKSFYATNPSDAQITAKVKALGLNAAQMVQFQATGIGMNMQQISAPVLETMYVDAANRLGTDIGGGTHGGWTSYFSPTLGRAVGKSEMQSFFASNPSQSQIFQKASELGLGVSAVNNMMIGLGITKAENMNSAYSQMDMSLYQGKDGYSLDQYGHVVAGGGHTWVGLDANTGYWEPKPISNGSSVNATA